VKGAGRAPVLIPALTLAVILTGAGPTPASAQGVLDRTANLSGGWVLDPGTIQFNFLHRFWIVEAGDDDKLVNSPTFLLGVPLGGLPFIGDGVPLGDRILLGMQYGTNSLVASGRFNEWEYFGRWAAPPFGGLPLRAAVTAAYNSAAESADGELSLSLPAGPLTLLGAGRFFSDAGGLGEAGWGVAGGAVYSLSPGVSLAADAGNVWIDGERGRHVWSAGLQLRIPTTPHTLSIQATNTRTGTLQGATLRDRTTWGMEFTIPITLARYIRRDASSPAAATEVTPAAPVNPTTPVTPVTPATPGRAEVTRTDDLRFVPDTVRIQVGDTVVWTNTTPLVHTVTAHPERVRDPEQIRLPEGAEPFDSGNMFEEAVFRHVFTVPGVYVYVCVPHDMVGMVGTVVVSPP
jgi:plastocyanin